MPRQAQSDSGHRVLPPVAGLLTWNVVDVHAGFRVLRTIVGPECEDGRCRLVSHAMPAAFAFRPLDAIQILDKQVVEALRL